jgi:hypothetical protein
MDLPDATLSPLVLTAEIHFLGDADPVAIAALEQAAVDVVTQALAGEIIKPTGGWLLIARDGES